MQIKKIKISNFLGIDEFGLDAAKVNLIKGPKGAGKSSVLEAIEKTFTNKNRRTEVIRHGTEESTLFVELDNGLEIDRRIRTNKSDYLKCRKENEVVPSTEKFLRSLINGDVFNPIDWVNMGIKEQTKSILAMLEIGWTEEDISKWFGETPQVDYNQHILQILKAIEVRYFERREEVNRKIRELKIQMKNIIDELPAEYDGEKWKAFKIQDYYSKVAEAQKINQFIQEAKSLQENLEDKIEAIKANGNSEAARTKLVFNDKRQDIKDIIDLSNVKINNAKSELVNLDSKVIKACDDIDKETEIKIQQLIQKLKEEAEELKLAEKKKSEQYKEEQKDLISINENKISSKNQELIGLGDLEKAEIKAIDERVKSEIEKSKIRVGNASKYLEENEVIEVAELQAKADEVAEMQSYLRQWDMYLDIRDGKLVEKTQESEELSVKIEKARKLPQELLAFAKMPVEGISVDSNGFIRINGTLIDGLSSGEKLELAMRIAKAQAGELKVICLDGWEKINEEAYAELLKEMEKDDYQYFVTIVKDTADGIMKVDKNV